MNASAHIVQLVRAHYRDDETSFVSAATSLARMSNSKTIQRSLVELIRQGHAAREANRPRGFNRQQSAPVSEASEMLNPLAVVGFPELMLAPSVQLLLDELVIELEYWEELAERKLRARNRLLFWGPPGNGKTSAAAALGNALGVAAYGVSLPRVMSKYMNETGQNLGQMFDALTPSTLIVFDEIDAIGSRRGDVDQAAGKARNTDVNTMLTLMDRHRVGVVVATTNRPDIVDAALLRRFDELIEFPAPSFAQMRALSERLCEGYGIPTVDVTDCANFDAVTKHVQREARRVVMAEILASEEGDSDDENEEDGQGTEHQDGALHS